MPRVHKDERGEEPHHIGRAERYDNREELVVREKIRKGEPVFLHLRLNRLYGHEYRCECQVYHDANPEIDHRHIELVRSTGSVTQRQNKASYQRREVEPLKYYAKHFTNCAQQVVIAQILCKDMENQEEIALCRLVMFRLRVRSYLQCQTMRTAC